MLQSTDFAVLSVPVLVCILTGCSPEGLPEPSGNSPYPVTDWLLSIELPETTLPVQLHLAEDGSEAWLSNGKEKVRVPEISQRETAWTLHFPAFNNTLVFEHNGGGLTGSLTLVKRGYSQAMALTGEPARGFRFVENAVPLVDVTGRWEVVFTDDEGNESLAVGEFDQQGPVLTGTFLTPLGDYRYLAGEVDGNTMHLSTFDGAHAFVFQAAVGEDGTLDGDFWSGTRWHESWRAKRNFDIRLPNAYELTYLNDGFERLEFSFPDLRGKAVSLDDDMFRDKVVLVSLAGTWCPNCGDETEFLSDVYRQYRGRGLEIVTLLYEHFEDFETAARLGRAFREKHDIEFQVLVAGSSDKVAAAQTLPMLNHVLAFPTLIFVDASGEVRRIHTGFSGPGTGKFYEEFKLEFRSFLDGLLREAIKEEP
jgi:peroxiredoxin